jgi:hypothetical protein
VKEIRFIFGIHNTFQHAIENLINFFLVYKQISVLKYKILLPELKQILQEITLSNNHSTSLRSFNYYWQKGVLKH